MRLRTILLIAALVSSAALSCERPVAADPEATARSIVAECADDWSCAHERWRREPRNWNCGLRAEVAWKSPKAPLLVMTTREIVTPELRGASCLLSAAARSAIYYRTAVSEKDSAEFPFAVFHWEALNQGAAGQKQVLAAVARARGDEQRLWRVIQEDSSLEAACVRFRGERDRCQAAPG